ncbi:MAG: AarF/ABC1/UbiB kinase family protein [Myxococcales bacterium]|nr:AarF/ABC1/UbiB kinase family protein [Myxococcales bacterium]
MSTIAQLLRLPQYARNLARLRHVTSVVARHGFGHVFMRAGLDKYAGVFSRTALSEADDGLANLTWEHRVRLCCEALGPTFVKLGQVAATRADILPMSLIQELRKLQDDVPPFPFEHVRQVVEDGLGNRRLEDVYAEVTPTPLAAASIAQVHRARLRNEDGSPGAEVVLKVQRPQLDRIIRTDLDLLHVIASALEERVPETRPFRPVAAIEEFARGLKRETDFRNEIESIERFRRNFAHQLGLHLPVTYPALSSRRHITMEFIDGCKVSDKARLAQWGVQNEHIAKLGTRIVIESIFVYGFFHADPHPGNFFILPDGRIALIDFGMMGAVDRDTIDDLLAFLVALLLNDPEMLVTQFIDLGLVEDSVNVRAMQGEIAEIMARYNGRSLAQIDIGTFIGEVFETVVRYHVRLPVELILIGKSISTMEGIAQDLYPQFNPLEELRPYLVELYLKRMLDPKTYSRQMYRVLHDWWGLSRVLPGEIRGVLRRIKNGELTLNLHDEGANQRARRHERSINRVLVSTYSLAAWALFTVVLLPALRGPKWGPLWWYAGILAAQGLFTGGLALVSWLRSREI